MIGKQMFIANHNHGQRRVRRAAPFTLCSGSNLAVVSFLGQGQQEGLTEVSWGTQGRRQRQRRGGHQGVISTDHLKVELRADPHGVGVDQFLDYIGATVGATVDHPDGANGAL